ncbi:hypothetical protein Pd630_LPD11030 (plasmid) [Rhodococcus opacus PD630]|nr:hypothetical protein Pd630_LPD11030 [Rhodococcus opacus PD630]
MCEASGRAGELPEWLQASGAKVSVAGNRRGKPGIDRDLL